MGYLLVLTYLFEISYYFPHFFCYFSMFDLRWFALSEALHRSVQSCSSNRCWCVIAIFNCWTTRRLNKQKNKKRRRRRMRVFCECADADQDISYGTARSRHTNAPIQWVRCPLQTPKKLHILYRRYTTNLQQLTKTNTNRPKPAIVLGVMHTVLYTNRATRATSNTILPY